MTNANQPKKLNELFNEALELRGLNVEKLAELTDIPIYYLTALSTGDFTKLPPAPYVRAYLMKIAEILRVDADLFLEIYNQEIERWPLKTSGPLDKLPFNRYAITPLYKKIALGVGIILILVSIYLIWRVDEFWGTPQIEITSPSADNLIINSPSIKLSGKVNSRDKLTINSEEIPVEKNGQFEKDLSLQSGINTVEFKVKRFLGKEVKVIKQVIYQP
jgi:cytoskeletal protein RodZ